MAESVSKFPWLWRIRLISIREPSSFAGTGLLTKFGGTFRWALGELLLPYKGSFAAWRRSISIHEDRGLLHVDVAVLLHCGDLFRRSADLDLQKRIQLFAPYFSLALSVQRLIHGPQLRCQRLPLFDVELPLFRKLFQQCGLLLRDPGALSPQISDRRPQLFNDGLSLCQFRLRAYP